MSMKLDRHGNVSVMADLDEDAALNLGRQNKIEWGKKERNSSDRIGLSWELLVLIANLLEVKSLLYNSPALPYTSRLVDWHLARWL